MDLDAGTVTLDQTTYITEMNHNMSDPDSKPSGRSRVVPCNGSILELTTATENIDPMYRSKLGQLGWLTNVSRPDVAFTYSVLSRHGAGGSTEHMAELRRAASYLERTKHYRIVYGGEQQAHVVDHTLSHTKVGLTAGQFEPMMPYTFTDSSHGGEKPMAGEVTFLNGSPVSWKAYRAHATSLSVSQGELSAAVNGTVTNMATMDNVVFMTRQKFGVPPFLFCDNTATVMLSEGNTSSKRMKHIATRIAFLREAVQDGKILLHHIGTAGRRRRPPQ